jgi:beta-glucosidase
LPVTFPASDVQGPARTTLDYPGDGDDVDYSEGTLVGYRWFDAERQQPLFPFGYGLSYTRFRFAALHVTRSRGGFAVTARITNTGARTGADVAQLYVGAPAAAAEPVRQLRGYAKLTLRPGQSKRVRLELARDSLASWRDRVTGWAVVRGTYQLYVGDSSRSLPLRARVQL